MQTIFPEEKMSAVVLGSRIRIITAANRFGLYSAFRARIAILFKSNFPQSRSTVATEEIDEEGVVSGFTDILNLWARNAVVEG